MGFLDDLKRKIGDFTLGVAGKTPAQTKTPRDLLLSSIDDSIAFHKDASFRVKSGRRKGKEPETVFTTSGQSAAIVLRYYRTRLKLDGKNDQLTVDVKHLDAALNALRDAAANGEFDAQMDKIKATRVSAAKTAKAKKP